MFYNSFRNGSTIQDPVCLFTLEDDKNNPISQSYGDFTLGNIDERLEWLVHQTFGVTAGEMTQYFEQNDPVLKIEITSKTTIRYSKKRGVIDGIVTYCIAAVSTNQNNFGLKQLILISRNGTAFAVHSNQINLRKQGDKIQIVHQNAQPQFHPFGWENPIPLPKPEPKVVRELFKN